jgi:hypothetical protein
MRLLQHRLSRRNSLTLLQMQNLGDLANKVNEKKNHQNNFGKKMNKGPASKNKCNLDSSMDCFK